MPRNSSGVMVLPAGNPVIPGTLVKSTWANPTMADLANEITASLPRNGAAPMTGPLVLARDGVLPKEATTVGQLNGAIAGSNNYLPAGAIQYFAMVAIPSGWLEANGAEVSRTTYANLFATIGTVFGTGNNTTTFNLPDLRGTFIRGFDNGRSVDPGRVFGTSQAGSNAAHSHGVSDPGHSHGASQPAHSHGVNDPGHSHVIDLGTGGGVTLRAGANQGSDYSDVNTLSAGTGVSIQASQPGVTVTASGSGISVGTSGGEARPVNLALVACIKAFGALQTDGLGTMAFQNKDSVNVTGGTGVFASLQCTKAPTEPNDVARFSDIGGVNTISSSDIQTVVVDNTNPSNPIFRPQSNVPWGMAKLNGVGQIPSALLPVSDINYQGPWNASSNNTPSQEFPLAVFKDGDTYQIATAGTLVLYGSDGLQHSVLCPVGSTITYVTGSPTFPSPGWYYNPPVSVSGVYASSVINIPAGNIAATNVQAAINELDSEKAPLANPVFSGNVGINVVGGSAKLEVGGNNADNAIASRSTYEGTLKIDDPFGATLQSSAGLEFKCSTYGSGYGAKLLAESDGTLLIGNRANSKDWTPRAKVAPNGDVLVMSDALLGYGKGGTVTQATSKSTTVTLNKPSGVITMHPAALAAGAEVVFTVNSALMSATDVAYPQITWGANLSYRVDCIYSGPGAFVLVVKNTSAGSLAEAVTINFAIIKGAIS